MKQKFNQIRLKLATIFNEHQWFIVITTVLLILLAMVLRINYLNNLKLAPEEAGDNKVYTPAKFNQQAIKKIQSLRDSNVAQPGTSIQQGRQNPFTE